MVICNQTDVAQIVQTREHGSVQVQPRQVVEVPDDAIVKENAFQVIEGPKRRIRIN